ncbi:hypothetical protein T484DRAFT_1767072, partial [Baffinella frigidus]
EALRLYRQAAELAPGVLKYLTNLSAVYFEMGDNVSCIMKCREFLTRAQEPSLLDGPAELRPAPALLAKAHSRMATALARSGDVSGAERSLEEAQRLLPDSAAIREQLEGLKSDPAETARAKGRAAYRARDMKAAVKCFSEAVGLRPDVATHWANRSAALYETGAHQACVTDCDAALLLPEMSEHRAGVRTEGEGPLLGTLAARLLARKGNAHRALGEEEEALAAFEKALRRVVAGTDEARELGEGFFDGIEMQRDQMLVAVSRKQNPNWEADERAEKRQAVGLETDRGGEMFAARRYRDALEYYDKAAALDPSDPALLLKQAAAHFEMNATSLAFTFCDRAGELAKAAGGVGGGMASVAVRTKGELWFRKGTLKTTSRDAAEMAFTEAGKCLRTVLADAGAPEEEREAARRGVERVDAEVSRRKRMDDCKEETANGDRMFAGESPSPLYGQFASAVAFYDKAVDADPDNASERPYLLFSSRGACSLQLKRYRQAMADADKTIALHATFTTGHILKARVCEMTEDWSGMMTSSVRAHDLEPENETALVLCRDALVSLLSDENVHRTGKHLQGFSPGGANAMAREDMQALHPLSKCHPSDMQEIMRDPKIQTALAGMQRAQGLGPLRPILDDLPACAKFCKLVSSGLLVEGA